ncbi:MAG TPA: CpsD/CapB family tyrosine-protein kinase, partial [Bryobacteraceae bacterium]|nr:CpsD/CapB family tyrosine-protein kinase [Bryobacteraceae bacterium]
LLIDADFRRASVSRMLGLPVEPGLANVLSGAETLQAAIVRVSQSPNLYVLAAGTGRANPAELLDSGLWRALCTTARERFSFVIVDTPPIAAVADYDLIQAHCDGVILVVRPDHTDRTLCKKSFEMVPQEKRLGVVLNCASPWFLWKTQESYYYSQRA